MADNPFGTPVAGLALEMAVRNQQLLDRIPGMTENQRRLINQRLTRYGGDLSQYEPYMEVGYDPTVGAMRSQAEGMRDYLIGLPELMAKAMKEGEKSGVTYKAPGVVTPFDFAKEAQKRKDIVQATDAIVAPNIIPSRPETPQPATPRPSQAGRLRPVRGRY